MAFRRISGELIKKRRGTRSQAKIAEASNGAFGRASLAQWEVEITSPNSANTVALIKALGCTWEQISVVVEPEMQA